MPYVDLNTIHNPATGTVAPATWGDGVRDNLEFLIDPPTCAVRNSAAVSIATGTTTTLNADTETFDNDAMHSTVTNTSRITAQTAGRYIIFGGIRFAANASGVRIITFRVNGTTSTDVQCVLSAGTSDTLLTATKSFVLAATDYVEIRATQTSGGNLNVTLEEFAAVFITR